MVAGLSGKGGSGRASQGRGGGGGYLLRGHLSVLTLISVSVPPPVFPHSAKGAPARVHTCTLRMWLQSDTVSDTVN